MKSPEQLALDALHASKTQEEANRNWDKLAALGGIPERDGDAPFAEPEPVPLCADHLAERISGQVLSVFTDRCPDVKMSYDDWMTLASFIECGIKEALGVPISDDGDESPEPVTVQ